MPDGRVMPFEDGEWGCPVCGGSGKREDGSGRCPTCNGSGAYQGILNPWGQWAVSPIVLETVEGGEHAGERCVCVDTFMCETTLTLDGAEELSRRLLAAVEQARAGAA